MNNSRLAGWAGSSNPLTPDEVSNRIKGIVFASSALIIFGAAKLFGIVLTAQDVLELGTQLATVGGLVWAMYGAGLALVRKIATVRR
jgi:hypothetical protein